MRDSVSASQMPPCDESGISHGGPKSRDVDTEQNETDSKPGYTTTKPWLLSKCSLRDSYTSDWHPTRLVGNLAECRTFAGHRAGIILELVNSPLCLSCVYICSAARGCFSMLAVAIL